jgi:hypothetical protein
LNASLFNVFSPQPSLPPRRIENGVVQGASTKTRIRLLDTGFLVNHKGELQS